MEDRQYNYTPLPEPVRITEQVWPEGTAPLVCTRTMAYMHEKYIAECIEGILMQRTTFPVQVIINEDASTDRTPEIIREYESRFPHVIKVVYQQVNSYGGSDRRERLAAVRELLKGKYEALCEGDDYWTDPLKLQRQVEWMEQHPDCNLTFHDVRIIDETGTFKEQERYSDFPWNALDRSRSTYTKEDLLTSTLCPTGSVVFRKPHGQEVPAWRRQLPFGDQPLFIHVLGEGQLKYFNETWGVYRRHSASASRDPAAKQRFQLGMVLMYLHLITEQPQKYRLLLIGALRQRIVEIGDPSLIQGDIRQRVEAVLPGYLFRRRFSWAVERVRRSWRRWRGRHQRMR